MKLSKSLVCCILLTLPFISAAAETYTFTNKEGKQLTAEVIGISAGKVSVNMNQQTVNIPISTLVEKDVVFLKGWLKANPHYAVRVSVFPKKGESKRTGTIRINNSLNSGRKAKTTSVEKEYFEMMLTNDSNVPLTNASIEYRVYITTTNDTGFSQATKRTRFEDGTIRVPKVDIAKTFKTATNTVVLENKTSATTLRSTTNYTDGTSETLTKTRRNRSRPEVQGIWIRVKVGSQVIKEYKKLEGALQRAKLVWN